MVWVGRGGVCFQGVGGGAEVLIRIKRNSSRPPGINNDRSLMPSVIDLQFSVTLVESTSKVLV